MSDSDFTSVQLLKVRIEISAREHEHDRGERGCGGCKGMEGGEQQGALQNWAGWSQYGAAPAVMRAGVGAEPGVSLPPLQLQPSLHVQAHDPSSKQTVS